MAGHVTCERRAGTNDKKEREKQGKKTEVHTNTCTHKHTRTHTRAHIHSTYTHTRHTPGTGRKVLETPTGGSPRSARMFWMPSALHHAPPRQRNDSATRQRTHRYLAFARMRLMCATGRWHVRCSMTSTPHVRCTLAPMLSHSDSSCTAPHHAPHTQAARQRHAPTQCEEHPWRQTHGDDASDTSCGSRRFDSTFAADTHRERGLPRQRHKRGLQAVRHLCDARQQVVHALLRLQAHRPHTRRCHGVPTAEAGGAHGARQSPSQGKTQRTRRCRRRPAPSQSSPTLSWRRLQS